MSETVCFGGLRCEWREVAAVPRCSLRSGPPLEQIEA